MYVTPERSMVTQTQLEPSATLLSFVFAQAGKADLKITYMYDIYIYRSIHVYIRYGCGFVSLISIVHVLM